MSTVTVTQPDQIIVEAYTENQYTVYTIASTAITVSVDASAGPIGLTGPQGDTGADVAVFFGTGDPPDPTGLDDGSLYFKY